MIESAKDVIKRIQEDIKGKERRSREEAGKVEAKPDSVEAVETPKAPEAASEAGEKESGENERKEEEEKKE